MVFPVQLGAEHDFFDPRVGRHVAVQEVIDALGLQAGFDIGHPSGGNHPGIADHQHLAGTEGLGAVADVVPATGTKDDFRRNEFTQLAETLAHWKACFLLF
ncbi:hypothetical protein D3C87_1605370 [compost metagenome]